LKRETDTLKNIKFIGIAGYGKKIYSITFNNNYTKKITVRSIHDYVINLHDYKLLTSVNKKLLKN